MPVRRPTYFDRDRIGKIIEIADELLAAGYEKSSESMYYAASVFVSEIYERCSPKPAPATVVKPETEKPKRKPATRKAK